MMQAKNQKYLKKVLPKRSAKLIDILDTGGVDMTRLEQTLAEHKEKSPTEYRQCRS